MGGGIYIASLLEVYKTEMEAELAAILNYWINHTLDENEGGFFGEIDENNHVVAGAPKGSVLNARILWSFSAAYNLTPDEQYLQIADRAWNYLFDHFLGRHRGEDLRKRLIAVPGDVIADFERVDRPAIAQNDLGLRGQIFLNFCNGLFDFSRG